jgi:catechol 2,3-dioxygenase-like lactoylglutathione lyase family enzyme
MVRRQLSVAVVLAIAASSGVVAASPEAQFEHVHVTVSDFRGAMEWYVTRLGGEPKGTYVAFGDFNVRFHPEKDAEIQGSAGSVIDHIAFSVADVEEAMRELAASGTKILEPVHETPDGLPSAVIEDPWGTRIEILEDPARRGFHHVCLRSPEPETLLAWLVKNLGGERARYRGRLDGIRYGDVWVVAENSGGELVAAVGAHLKNENAGWRALDHLGFRVADLAAMEEAMKSAGIRFTVEPMPFLTARLAGVEGPDGLVVELVDVDP